MNIPDFSDDDEALEKAEQAARDSLEPDADDFGSRFLDFFKIDLSGEAGEAMTDEEAAILAEALIGIPEGSIAAATALEALDTVRPPPPSQIGSEPAVCRYCAHPATVCDEHAKQAIEAALSDDADAAGSAAIRTAERKLRGEGRTLERDAEALALVIRRAWPEQAAELARAVLTLIEGDPQ